MPILPRTPSTTHTRPADLEELARTLVALGASRATVELVERWSEVGEPTPAARIAEARAFVDLRLVDRAWSRLRDLIEAPEPSREALVVAIELFLLREWHERARKLVAWAVARDPTDPGLRALQARAVEPPTAVEPPNVDPEELTVAELVASAEQHMAHGTFIKARSMLERARRRAPDNLRAKDLLWALNGDFTVEGSLDALYRRLSEQVSVTPDETEQTEFLPKEQDREELHASGIEPKFSSLFRAEKGAPGEGRSKVPGLPLRGLLSPEFAPDADAPGQRTVESMAGPSASRRTGLEALARGPAESFGQPRVPSPPGHGRPPPRGGNTPRATPERGDRTAVSSVADLEVATRRSSVWGDAMSDHTEARDATDGGDDTQIARVVRPTGAGRRLDPPSLTGNEADEGFAPAHHARSAVRRFEGELDRVALRGEAEDDSVVVHTRRASGRSSRGREADPVRAVEAEASHERQATRWRQERARTGITEPRVPRPTSGDTTAQLDMSPAEKAFFRTSRGERSSVVHLFGAPVPTVYVAAMGLAAGALLVLGLALAALAVLLG